MRILFLRKLGPKIVVFRGFINFFQNDWIVTQVINVN